MELGIVIELACIVFALVVISKDLRDICKAIRDKKG